MQLRGDDCPRIQTARTRRVRLRCNESARLSTQLRSNAHEEEADELRSNVHEEEADEHDDFNF